MLLAVLPATLTPLKRTVENIKDPLYRLNIWKIKSGFKLFRQEVQKTLKCGTSLQDLNHKFPICFFRFFEREVNFGLKLLVAVRTDLEDVVAITSSGMLGWMDGFGFDGRV